MTIAVCLSGYSSVARHRLWTKAGAALGAALVVAAIPAQAADATRQTYHERTLILAASAKCGFFKPEIEQALGAAALQTRGVLLRAGYEASAVGAIAARAQAEATGLSCSDAGLRTKASRILHAFERWGRAARVEFPAQSKSWRVDRFQRRDTGWLMVQDSRVGASPVRFGLAGHSPSQVQPTVVVSFQGRSRPYAARLVTRDTRILPRPHGVANGRASMPPLSERALMLASNQSSAPSSLLSEGSRRGEAWTFGDEAMRRLSQLDPREPFWIEFLFRDDSIARVPFEVGDIAAAKTFLDLGAV